MARNVDAALTKARHRGNGVVAAITVPVRAGIDPLEHISAARGNDEPWSTFIQPARSDLSIATLGAAAVVEANGPGRFAALARDCGELLDAAEADDLFSDPIAPPGSGVIWCGGFAFNDDDPWGDAWHETRSAQFVLPRVAIARSGGEDPVARLTIAIHVQPDDETSALISSTESLIERLALDADLAEFRNESRPAHQPDQGTAASSAAPEHYENAVARATELISSGEIEKIVLAREVTLRRDHPIDIVNAVRGLRARFPECTTFAVGIGDRAFIGASPELLIRREGRRASTMALAGSMRRGEDEATDRRLGEQLLTSDKDNREHAIVVRQIERTLGRISAWIAAGEKPQLVKVKNIQHLATPIRAQLTEPRPAIELAGLLHPTPAVGGEPWPEVSKVIKTLEGFDRGWYTGGVGWMDLLEDGEFHVALRSALINGNRARLFVGAGIVGDSDPSDELAETETKLQALLPVLREC
ncbi:MAG: isochorismate synthase [Solirubrobacterales bacterium]